MSTENLAPIIVKKKKVVGGHGHHGGAWKVAYADFVTAMMAFFLLMWLLNATTEKQRKGLADYFSPTIPVSRISGGGDGQFWGESVFSEEALPQTGTGATMERPSSENQALGALGVDVTAERVIERAPDARIQDAQNLLEQLQARGGESMAQLMKMRHVITRLTEEGLVFDIFETPDIRLFRAGTNEPTEELRIAVRHVVDGARIVANDISISAHLAARPLILAENPVWDVTSGRANVVRQMAERLGFPARRIQKVIGFADRKPAVSNPLALRNNRIEITLLRDGV
ncbi:flagellar motor protein MotB [Mangrovicoccus algicola]|uniref:Chemotaxis protein MotB n=1 Tax=Mangrovicoccus algicola TaxID=2771008 RepID=A0A8J6Z882_9RHOB|nr:flagellar motor protein MotB [Mangrovicoccus algicola]MBE3639714.1 chemotaxis protein MotB [Mangrovicoccus algicola]